jgi:hypothetical protein
VDIKGDFMGTSRFVELHQEKVYDGRWKVIDIEFIEGKSVNYYVILENIYNQEQMKITKSSFYNIENGKTSVSAIRRLKFTKHQITLKRRVSKKIKEKQNYEFL